MQAFARLDENHDNFLSPVETAYMNPAREHPDANHDGKLSEDEFVNGYIKELDSTI